MKALEKSYKKMGIKETPSDIVKTISLCYNTTKIHRIEEIREDVMEEF